MADFEIKANDRLPIIEAVLGYGAPAVQADLDDLATALADPATVVSFIMRKQGDPAAKVDAPATVVDAAARRVRYDWLAVDTDTPGSYQAEWEVIFPSGKPQTFPLRTYHSIDILADLDGDGTSA
jgi:hypothetical protein